MKPELDAALCEKYPEIFADRHGSPRRTLMCWGFSCGDGWYHLIDELCATLMLPVHRAQEQHAMAAKQYAAICDNPDSFEPRFKEYYTAELVTQRWMELRNEVTKIPRAVQVKEKWGRLCFYTDNTSDLQREIIFFAENLSARICEDCGTMDTVKLYTNGWHKTLCSMCVLNARRVRVSPVAEPDENQLWGV